MPRPYVVSFEDVNISAAQDLLQIKGATGKMLRILSVSVGATDTTMPTAQMIKVRCRFLPATVTDGSGGSSPTPQALDPGDSAASFTAKANNTTQATTSGTAAKLGEWGVHLFSGLDYTFPKPPAVGPSESFVFELLAAPTGTVHMSGMALVEEIGG
jgi:hypothetical protein